MRLAVISDIHANVVALEAVLEDIADRGVDAIVNLGDCVSGPLWPKETMELLEARAIPTVRDILDGRKVEVVTAQRSDTCKAVVDRMKAHGISQMPVVEASGNAVGMIHEGDLLNAIVSGKGKLSDPTGKPIFNKEYNPEGKYDAITFCDGEESPTYFCNATKHVVDFCAKGAKTPVAKSDELRYATEFCQAENSTVDTASDADGTPDDVRTNEDVISAYLGTSH